MKKEITDFYNEAGKPIDKMVAVGVARLGLTGEAIKEAAKILYHEIQDGLDVKPIRVAWEVFDRAKKVHYTKAHDQDKKEEELRGELKSYREDNERLRLELGRMINREDKFNEYISLPWYKRLRRPIIE